MSEEDDSQTTNPLLLIFTEELFWKCITLSLLILLPLILESLILIYVKFAHPNIPDDKQGTTHTLEYTGKNFKNMANFMLSDDGLPKKHHDSIRDWLSITELNATNYSESCKLALRNLYIDPRPDEKEEIDGRMSTVLLFDPHNPPNLQFAEIEVQHNVAQDAKQQALPEVPAEVPAEVPPGHNQQLQELTDILREMFHGKAPRKPNPRPECKQGMTKGASWIPAKNAQIPPVAPKDRLTPMMKIINYHVNINNKLSMIQQCNLGMSMSKNTKLQKKSMSFRGVIEILQQQGKPALPGALEYSVVRNLKDKEWDYQELGTRLDPATLAARPWKNLKDDANSYVDSFLWDVWVYWIKVWFSVVLLGVVFA